jgi:hypothetical protein
VRQRKHPGANHREQCHRFGEPINGGAPFLQQEQENGGDERSGVANPNPPDEIHNREPPGDGNVDPPNADSKIKQVAQCDQQHSE